MSLLRQFEKDAQAIQCQPTAEPYPKKCVRPSIPFMPSSCAGSLKFDGRSLRGLCAKTNENQICRPRLYTSLRGDGYTATRALRKGDFQNLYWITTQPEKLGKYREYANAIRAGVASDFPKASRHLRCTECSSSPIGEGEFLLCSECALGSDYATKMPVPSAIRFEPEDIIAISQID